MAKDQPVVAHLGRPETPAETAARKAANTQAYRSSKTTRNLVVALLVSLAVVAIIVWGVPRGSLPARDSIDLSMVTREVSQSVGHPVIEPPLPEGWRANEARLSGTVPQVWTVAISLDAEDSPGFARLQQAIGVDDTWTAQQLDGRAPTGSITLGGREWDEFATDGSPYALASQVGGDQVLIQGTFDPAQLHQIAVDLDPQLDAIERRSTEVSQ